MLWGMFKKVVIADNLDPLVSMVYLNTQFSGPLVMLGTIAFGFQIYCDFSGYSDIARGTARVLGFDIMLNFHLPYIAKNIREFWRRWHISLSTWLRDYLYISLGGNRRGEVRTYFNLFITMLLGGLWHGAAWNFALWGAWHGGGLILHRALTSGRNAQIQNRKSKIQNALGWLFTMLFVFYGWLLFRAQSFDQIVTMTRAFGQISAPPWFASYALNLAVLAAPLVLMEIWQARSNNFLVPLTLSKWARAILQGALLIAIVLFWYRKEVPFIYFQF
jgi:D-alanyl-lipoteichoic acid acyltransferase DltB (MBOAT superfamily)